MMTVRNDSVTALDLSRVIMLNSVNEKKQKTNVLSQNDLAYQEARRSRKIRKLDFEIR